MEKVLSSRKKISVVDVAKWCVLVGVFYIVNRASIGMGYLKPFGFGLYYAMMFGLSRPWEVSACYLVSHIFADFSLNGLYVSLNLIFVALVFKWLHSSLGRKAHWILVCIYSLLGNIVYIILHTATGKEVILTTIAIMLGELFLLCCMYLFRVSNRSLKAKFTTDEVMCMGLVIAVVAMGLSSMTIFKVELVKVIAVLLIMILSYTATNRVNLLFSAFYGIGASLYYSNIGYMAGFVIFSMCAIGFKSSYKIITAVAMLLCEVVLGLYFHTYSTYTVFSVLSVGIGQLVFMLIPARWLNILSDHIKGLTENVAVRSIINRSRDTLTKRMIEVSNVFCEMDTVYKQMVQGVLPEKEAKQMIKNELVSKCCKGCEHRNKCSRVNGKIFDEVLDHIVDIGFDKGRLNLLDVPQHLTTSCGRVNYLLSTLNALLGSYKRYNVMVSNMDASKILMADQLKGVSILLKSLAEEVNTNIVYDVNKETRIKEELGYNNLCCLEALVYEQSANIKYVSLILAEKEVDEKKIEKVVSKIAKSKMSIVSVNDSLVSGAKEVLLKTRANYDIVFGSAAQTKTGRVLSGDTHSLIKIDDDKYMVALCDGMGSGENAHKVSDLTITLIENFYKAGFDNDIILSSVNKLLSIGDEENFSALDICVFDLRNNLMDFIKLGSPTTFIKHKFETENIESSGLPIGILDEMKPHITKKVFTEFDMVVLVSDGVYEAFGEEELNIYINNLDSTNPQTIADQILDRAVELVDGKLEDDFTVVAVRLFPLV